MILKDGTQIYSVNDNEKIDIGFLIQPNLDALGDDFHLTQDFDGRVYVDGFDASYSWKIEEGWREESRDGENGRRSLQEL